MLCEILIKTLFFKSREEVQLVSPALLGLPHSEAPASGHTATSGGPRAGLQSRDSVARLRPQLFAFLDILAQSGLVLLRLRIPWGTDNHPEAPTGCMSFINRWLFYTTK